MVRYERFGLGATWNVEYGSADVAEELGWLLAYSPYHRVVEGTDYPAVLFTVFDGDSRVDPLHARKLCGRPAARDERHASDPAARRARRRPRGARGEPKRRALGRCARVHGVRDRA